MLRPRPLIPILLALAGSAPVFAGSDVEHCLRLVYRQVVREAARGYLRPEDVREIRGVFRSDLPGSEKVDRAMRVAAEARARGMPREARDHLSRLTVHVAVSRDKPDARVRGTYRQGGVQVRYEGAEILVVLPERYHATLIELFVKYHEFMHAAARSLTDVSPRELSGLPLEAAVRQRYLDEVQAMLGEYEVLHALPSEERGAMLATLETDSLLPPEVREFLVLSLEASFEDSPGRYLQRQFEGGRYNLDNVKGVVGRNPAKRGEPGREERILVRRTHEVLPAAASGRAAKVAAGLGGFLMACDAVRRSPAFRDGLIARKLCPELGATR